MSEAPTLNLRPVWAGQFDTFDHWVSRASSRLRERRGNQGEPIWAFCVDALGRRCHIGGDFMRARDEGAFPVRWFWEMEVAP
jgi:hypothetical protein